MSGVSDTDLVICVTTRVSVVNLWLVDDVRSFNKI